MSKKEELIRLDVQIIRDTFMTHDGSGYAVYEVEVFNIGDILPKDELPFYGSSFVTKVKGNFEKKFHAGEEYSMYCVLEDHPRYGKQYKVQIVQAKFDTVASAKAFLMEFCEPSIVNQLIEHYGAGVIEKILNKEVDTNYIKGMGSHRFNLLYEKVKENEYMKDIIIELGEFGITPLQMKKAVALFGANAVQRIKENPYELCKISGIGFLKADEIAQGMGFDMKSPFRVKECIKYVLMQNSKDGHSWMERDEVIQGVQDNTRLSRADVEKHAFDIEGVVELHDGDGGNERFALEKAFKAEKFIAETLLKMRDSSTELDYDADAFIEEQMKKYNITLTDEQKQIFYNLKKNRVNFLVGYAGCGKSFLQKMILNLMDKMKKHVLLLAPTGKAAKVMEGYTGRDASTIHRAVGYIEGFDEVKDIIADFIILDEASMADIYILRMLFKALKNPNVRILIVGDDFQIPSVGVGNFLHDCIESNAFLVTKLTKVFRQEDGGILDIATKTRLKQKFISTNFLGKAEFGSDTVIWCVPQEKMVNGYTYCYKQALEAGYKVDDIIILSPRKAGELGTEAVNKTIQSIVNPPADNKREVNFHNVIFREGDRVINIKNNYKALIHYKLLKGADEEECTTVVYNGDTGVIVEINDIEKYILIDYGFDIIRTYYIQLETILHSYCLTIHKSQGSGFSAVIVLADKAHKWQLNANLLYTAWTRAKKFLRGLCQADVINSAMRKNVNLTRNTFLCEFLKN